MANPKPFTTVADFLFNAPMYAEFKLADDLEDAARFYGKFQEGGRIVTAKVDGYCPFCRKESTFRIQSAPLGTVGDPWALIDKRVSHDLLSVTCSRADYHIIRFYIRIDKLVIQKIGQFPSLATIANEQNAAYKSVLKGTNADEFHRAIGLAAHGVGIGSFVYLRRIFERLIRSRFDEFKEVEGWSDEDFVSKRMVEKVALLKDHLPPFLVENRKIYSILSLGVHELEEDQCLQFFPVLKSSIIIILEEDKKKKEELELRKSFAKAIAGFEGKPNASEEENHE